MCIARRGNPPCDHRPHSQRLPHQLATAATGCPLPWPQLGVSGLAVTPSLEECYDFRGKQGNACLGSILCVWSCKTDARMFAIQIQVGDDQPSQLGRPITDSEMLLLALQCERLLCPVRGERDQAFALNRFRQVVTTTCIETLLAIALHGVCRHCNHRRLVAPVS